MKNKESSEATGKSVQDMTPGLSRSQMIHDKLDNACYRILYLPENDNSQGFWIPVNTATNIPKAFDPADVKEKLMIGTMEKVADSQTVPSDADLSQKCISRRDRAWNLIRHVVTKEPDIYIASKRAELLKLIEDASGVKMNNLYGYLGKYWRSGFQPNALAPDYRNCGGARTVTNLKNRPGRKKRAGQNGKALTDRDFEAFRYAIGNYYQKGKGSSLTDAYNQMLASHYTVPRSADDASPVTMDADEKPSFTQFYYWHHKHGDAVEDACRREGEHQFNLKYRAITGRTETGLFGPGASFQIDATIGDFYLVMKSDKSRLVGRPVIVFLKDAWSRMITGMNITLENSSCNVWKEALLNSITSKADYCKKYGLMISESDWPCRVLPVSITTDNGEFAVKAVDSIVQGLGITVENCPPYRGDLKGIIERTFKTHQLALRPYVPGYVDRDAGQRGAEDYRKNSCLDLETFTAIMIKVVLYYNNSHYMETYPRTDDMREKKIPAVPRELWNYGVSHLSGALRTVQPDDYLDVLLQPGEAKVTGKGIELNHLYYTSAEAAARKWFERARIEGPYSIPVRYTPSSCEHIYVKGSDNKFITCSLVSAFAPYGNSTGESRDAAHEEDLDAMAAFRQAEDQAYAELAGFIETNVKRCKNERQNGSKIIASLNRHSINENKAAEMKEASGENKARREQAGLAPGSLPEAGNGTGTHDVKPKSFGSVSDELDKMMAGLGMDPREAPQDPG